MHRTPAARLAIALLALFLATPARPSPAAPAAAPPARTEVATFAGGCFWSMETQFDGLPGVRSLTVGYTGGWKKRPTYEEVCSHTTGHLEALQVVFDPAVVTYAQLLDRYWHSIDPTQPDGQFCDIGDSYRSAIFTHGEAQQRAALASKTALERSGALHAPIATAVRPAADFWPAEDYHQHFARKNPQRYHEYREGCGRDRELAAVWGAAAVKPLAH